MFRFFVAGPTTLLSLSIVLALAACTRQDAAPDQAYLPAIDGQAIQAHVALLADDDPVIPVRGLDELIAPPSLTVVRSPRGGHCGFLSDLALNSWVNGFVLEQLEQG